MTSNDRHMAHRETPILTTGGAVAADAGVEAGRTRQWWRTEAMTTLTHVGVRRRHGRSTCLSVMTTRKDARLRKACGCAVRPPCGERNVELTRTRWEKQRDCVRCYVLRQC